MYLNTRTHVHITIRPKCVCMHAQVQRAITKISLLKIIQKEKKFNILAMYKYQAYAHMHAQMLDAAGNEMLHISL